MKVTIIERLGSRTLLRLGDGRRPQSACGLVFRCMLALPLAVLPALSGALAGGLGEDDSSSSSSNASNYDSGASLSVNTRTGALSLQMDLVSIPGVVGEMPLSLALSYRGEDAVSNEESDVRYFGLPYGFALDIGYIDRQGSSSVVNVDGSQSYTVDSNWTTVFTAAGSSETTSVLTGLKQYNRADANFRTDAATVTVGNLASAHVFSTLDGMARYFSEDGLLLQQSDRFGNSIQYFYDLNAGPRDTRLTSIVDTWGNTVSFSYCNTQTDTGCESGQVTITLPDGRSVAWVAPDQHRVTKIIDTLGMVTHLVWESSPCERGGSVLTGLTSPTGASTAVQYTCINVCTAASNTSCQNDGAVTTWPVVEKTYECPNNDSGTVCPAGSSSDDYLTTTYDLGADASANNYTGFPLYSPYAPADAGADALMSSNDAAFTYTVIVAKRKASGSVAYQTEYDYNFLHLHTESRMYVAESGSSGLVLTKEESYCYPVSDASNDDGCPLSGNYQNLPANYQSPTITGSCVYASDDSGQARRSTMTNVFNAFGHAVNSKTYHSTADSGIVSSCDRNTRLSSTGLTLVKDEYSQYDTPTDVGSDGFLEIGPDSGSYGLALASQSLVYLDEDESGAASELLRDSSSPVLVTLTCNDLTTEADAVGAGAAVATSSVGLMAVDAVAPEAGGEITACTSRSWDSTVAPPKSTDLSFDERGRVIAKTLSWTEGFSLPSGIASTSESYAYDLAATDDGEESCGDGAAVLHMTHTDALGHASVARICSLNGFHLSSTDANGDRTLYEHAVNGLVSKVTHPNGTIATTDYYYACPVSQDGSTHTCPDTATAQSDCPHDDQGTGRTCTVTTLGAGAGNQSYADGILHVVIKDGLGRLAATRDNLGAGSAGGGFSSMQTTSQTTHNDLGLKTLVSQSIGASDPLVYETATTYDSRLRPSTVCGPRGNAQQYAYDEVSQRRALLHNGHFATAVGLNDGLNATVQHQCALIANSPTSGTTCPTVADDPSETTCPGEAYATVIQNDGSGLQHTVISDAGTSSGTGSVLSVSGIATFSADRLSYGYSYTGDASASDGDASASTAWSRDLHGLTTEWVSSVDGGDGSSSTQASDSFSFNERGDLEAAVNQMVLDDGSALQESYTYSPTRQMATRTSYAGVLFHRYYDEMDRLVRYCFASEGGGSEGETISRDPISGDPLEIAHFTNPSDCSECADGDCGDVVTDSLTYTYTTFGAIASKTYSDGTVLQWAYDSYQRMSCFADGMATAAGGSCPSSPTDASFSPSADEQLVTYAYWEDDDPYRRGQLKSMCRGVPDGTGDYVTRCMDYDYYTPVDSGGSCDSDLATITGAYSGQTKTEIFCSGGSCADGGGSVLYQTTHLYDAHGRPCSVQSTNESGQLIRGSTYEYDQYDHVTHEEHSSDLDPSSASNYQMDYVYDGLLRLTAESRSDADGVLLETTSYAYDAAANLIRKVRQYVETSSTPAATATVAATLQPTITATTVVDQPAPLTPTPGTSPAATGTPADHDDDSGSCQVGPSSRNDGWLLLAPLSALLLLRRRAALPLQGGTGTRRREDR